MTSDLPRLVPARRGFSIEYRGKTLLSRIDPLAQAERIVQDADLREGNLYICPSPLLAYGLELLLSSSSPRNAILCLETDPQLHALSSQALAALNPEFSKRICLAPLSANSPASLVQLADEIWGLRRFRRLIPIKTNSAWTLDSASYESMEKTLRQEIHRSWSNTMTLLRLGRLYAANFTRNSHLLAKAPSLSSSPNDSRPFLALGAGPGLDLFLDEHKELLWTHRSSEDRPFGIICVDTAVLPLLQRGIHADAALVLEAQYWNLLDFMGAPGVPIILDLCSHYASWRAVAAPGEAMQTRALITTSWAPLRLFERMRARGLLPRELPALGSVGLSLVELGLSLTRGPVVTAGLDFSFSPDSFHTKGTSHSLMHETAINRLKPLFRPERAFRPGIHRLFSKSGAACLSDPSLESYSKLFIERFGGNIRILDAGREGLDLGSTRIGAKDLEHMLCSPKTEGDRDRQATDCKRPLSSAQDLKDFIGDECSRLERFRAILSGMEEAQKGECALLLEELDYLWAHFSEYGGQYESTELALDASFLKRVRAEIDRSLKNWTISLEELDRQNK